LFVCFLFSAVVISLPAAEPSAHFVFFIFLSFMLGGAGIPFRVIFARMLPAIPFAVAGALSCLLVQRNAAFYIYNFAVTQGVLSAASILLKMTLTVAAALLIVATTPYTELAAILTANKMFRLFGLQLLMSFRYISVLLDEAGAMNKAYLLRAPYVRAIKMKDMGAFLGQLLLRSFEKSERIYIAMKCRAFDGTYHGGKKAAPSKKDLAFITIASAAIIFCRIVNVSKFLGGLL
jgi:cobalt/nickel transport system permease protein